MHRNPPPIHLLVTFEAVARLSSVRLAAAECFVTPSAVSQQVKLLEDHLNIELVAREGRGLVVTRAGRVVAEWANRVVAAFQGGHSDALALLSEPFIRLSVTDYVSHEILIPALPEFHVANPEIELRLETSMLPVNFETEPVDAAIRLGVEPFAGLEARELGAASAVIVGSRAIAERLPLLTADDLNQHTLVYARERRDDWEPVAKFLGSEALRPKRRIFVDGYLASLRAAEEGVGIAICLVPMSEPWIREKRLVALTPAVPTGLGNFFVFRPGGLKTRALGAVYAWAKEQFDRAGKGPGAPRDLSREETGGTRKKSERTRASRPRTRS